MKFANRIFSKGGKGLAAIKNIRYPALDNITNIMLTKHISLMSIDLFLEEVFLIQIKLIFMSGNWKL